MSDTTNKHIGNILSKVSEESLQEILEQYAKKIGIDIYSNNWKEKCLIKLKNILDAERHDSEGNIIE